MKSAIITSLLLMLMFGNVMAQKRTITVTGKVTEQNGEIPVEAATVQLLALPDSSQAAGNTTNKTKGTESSLVSAFGFHATPSLRVGWCF